MKINRSVYVVSAQAVNWVTRPVGWDRDVALAILVIGRIDSAGHIQGLLNAGGGRTYAVSRRVGIERSKCNRSRPCPRCPPAGNSRYAHRLTVPPSGKKNLIPCPARCIDTGGARSESNCLLCSACQRARNSLRPI